MPPPLIAFVIIFLLGSGLRASALLGKPHAQCLAKLVFSVSLPATILISLDRLTFAAGIWKLPVAACLVTLPVLLVSWLIARRLRLPRSVQGSFLVATGLINSVYFGYPVVLATWGEAGLGQAVLFDLGQTFLTLTVMYALSVSHGQTAPTGRLVMARVLSAPPLWALSIIGILKLMGSGLPTWLHTVLIPLHLTTTPLASLVLGLSISVTAIRRNFRLALLGMLVRMGGGMVFGFSAAWLLNLEDLQRAVVILVAAMPSAVNAVIYASDTGLDEEMVTSAVAMSVLVGMALLPALPRLAEFLLH
jgi:predicted permease